ncbi:MAG: ABC transporter permease [Lachnospiraceae bacterium]|nr:ABC transporter permease [Lachnospiraceae bacterium]
MIRYYGGKILIFIVSIFVLSFLVFTVSRMAPGDPLVSYYGDRVEKMTLEEREHAENRLGLRDPMLTQYQRFLEKSMQGDFGISYKYKRSATEVVLDRLPYTLVLGGVGFVLIFSLALLLGIVCAVHEDRLLDQIICKVGTVTSCIPEFWVSLMLILIFAVELKLLPSSGAHSLRVDTLSDRLLHLILPMTVVVLGHLWYYAYMIRNKILEEIRRDYVLLAKAKGLSKRKILYRHCVRNMIPSYLSLMAISVPHILGGTYIVETVFSFPGIGTLAYESARFHDYNLLMLLSLLSGMVVILGNMVAQIINERIDPRIRAKEAMHER